MKYRENNENTVTLQRKVLESVKRASINRQGKNNNENEKYRKQQNEYKQWVYYRSHMGKQINEIELAQLCW